MRAIRRGIATEWFHITVPSGRRIKLHRSCIAMQKIGGGVFPGIDVKQAVGKTKFLKRYFRRGGRHI